MRIAWVLAAVASLWFQPVAAATFLLTVSGTVQSGFDEPGTFGEINRDLTGLPFEAVFTLNLPTPGTTTYAFYDLHNDVTTGILGGSDFHSPSPVSAILVIAGVTDQFFSGASGGSGTVERRDGGQGPGTHYDSVTAAVSDYTHDGVSSHFLSYGIYTQFNQISDSYLFWSDFDYTPNPDDDYNRGAFGLKAGDYPETNGILKASSISMRYVPGTGPLPAPLIPVRTSVPEPSTWMFALLGIGLIGLVLRKRKSGLALS